MSLAIEAAKIPLDRRVRASVASAPLREPAQGSCGAPGGSRSGMRFQPAGFRPGIPWHCIYAKPNEESRAEREIIKQGFAAWAPMEIVRLPDRHIRVRPMLPRYLFAQFDADAEPWGSLRDTRGVSHVLTDSALRPLVVPDAALSIILDHCAPNGVVPLPEEREVRRRDVVRVLDGPWRDFSGIVGLTAKTRVEVMLMIFGRLSPIPFRRDQVELVA